MKQLIQLADKVIGEIKILLQLIIVPQAGKIFCLLRLLEFPHAFLERLDIRRNGHVFVIGVYHRLRLRLGHGGHDACLWVHVCGVLCHGVHDIRLDWATLLHGINVAKSNNQKNGQDHDANRPQGGYNLRANLGNRFCRTGSNFSYTLFDGTSDALCCLTGSVPDAALRNLSNLLGNCPAVFFQVV